MRRFLASALLIPALAACGDDGKTAPRGAPEAPPPASSPSTPPPPGAPPVASAPSPAPPSPTTGSSNSPWRATRVGDAATWEIRVVGSTSVTKLTWRATRVDAVGVRYAVQARRIDVEGATKSLVESEEFHAAGGESTTPGVVEQVMVAGRPVATERSTRGDGASRTTIWTSPTVPFSGLVKSTNADVEQVLVAFSRAP